MSELAEPAVGVELFPKDEPWYRPRGFFLHKLAQHTEWITAVAYSPDGVLLASGDRNGGLRVWEAGTAADFYTLNGHKAAITRLCFRADSNVLASASEDGTVKLWDAAHGRCLATLEGHAAPVRALAFSADGKALASGGDDRTVRAWDPAAFTTRLYSPNSRNVGAHWPTNRASCLAPPIRSASDTPIDPRAAHRNGSDGTWAV